MILANRNFQYIFYLLLLLSQVATAQTDSAKACSQKDIGDLIRKKNATVKPEKNASVLIVPVISSNPATGIAFGAAGQYVWAIGSGNNKRMSSISANFLYTTKHQTLFFVKNNVYALKNKLFLSGDWRLYFFSETTYGLGTNAPEGTAVKYIWGLNGLDTKNDSTAQVLRYNYIKFHQTASYEVYKNIFAGIGVHLDHYYSVKDQQLDTVIGEYTSHYLYSLKHGFSPGKYTVFGVSANFVYDTRDNMINPYKGYFVNANFRFNPTFLGSTQQSSISWLEYRSYHNISRQKSRNLVAFWVFSNFVTGGEVPYLNLPAIGYDQRGRSGRGYALGRYRGEDLIYAESEFRFQISPCTGILGGDIFINATTASNKDAGVKLFNYIRPGYGGGLRIMIDKKTRTNIGLDIGLGNKTAGFYINASETF